VIALLIPFCKSQSCSCL